MAGGLLLQRVRYQRKHFLVFVQKQTGRKVAEALIRETGGREELEALNLPKVCSLTQGKQVEQLGYIVPSGKTSATAPDGRAYSCLAS